MFTKYCRIQLHHTRKLRPLLFQPVFRCSTLKAKSTVVVERSKYLDKRQQLLHQIKELVYAEKESPLKTNPSSYPAPSNIVQLHKIIDELASRNQFFELTYLYSHLVRLKAKSSPIEAMITEVIIHMTEGMKRYTSTLNFNWLVKIIYGVDEVSSSKEVLFLLHEAARLLNMYSRTSKTPMSIHQYSRIFYIISKKLSFTPSPNNGELSSQLNEVKRKIIHFLSYRLDQEILKLSKPIPPAKFLHPVDADDLSRQDIYNFVSGLNAMSTSSQEERKVILQISSLMDLYTSIPSSITFSLRQITTMIQCLHGMSTEHEEVCSLLSNLRVALSACHYSSNEITTADCVMLAQGLAYKDFALPEVLVIVKVISRVFHSRPSSLLFLPSDCRSILSSLALNAVITEPISLTFFQHIMQMVGTCPKVGTRPDLVLEFDKIAERSLTHLRLLSDESLALQVREFIKEFRNLLTRRFSQHQRITYLVVSRDYASLRELLLQLSAHKQYTLMVHLLHSILPTAEEVDTNLTEEARPLVQLTLASLGTALQNKETIHLYVYTKLFASLERIPPNIFPKPLTFFTSLTEAILRELKSSSSSPTSSSSSSAPLSTPPSLSVEDSTKRHFHLRVPMHILRIIACQDDSNSPSDGDRALKELINSVREALSHFTFAPSTKEVLFIMEILKSFRRDPSEIHLVYPEIAAILMNFQGSFTSEQHFSVKCCLEQIANVANEEEKFVCGTNILHRRLLLEGIQSALLDGTNCAAAGDLSMYDDVS